MDTDPIRVRHYKPIPDLVRRDKGDVPHADFAVHLADRLAAFLPLDATQPPPVRPASPSLIPSADGAISRVLLTIPNYAVNNCKMSAAYRSLISSLPSTTALVVLAQAESEETVKKWVEAAGRADTSVVEPFDDDLRISVWAEDGYVMAKDKASGATYFIEPIVFLRAADGLVAEFVTNSTDLKNTQAPLYFQGGNTLIGDDFFLIGEDYIKMSLEHLNDVLIPPEGVPPEEFVDWVFGQFLDRERKIIHVSSRLPVPTQTTRPVTINGENWTEVICAGNASGTTQPIFHIDMFITLVGRVNGKYRILVGDPALAFRILGRDAPDNAMAPVFDDIADNLSSQGFDVQRNPLPLAHMDDPDAKQRVWYFATSNNALVQNAPTKEVWLPTYAYGDWTELAATDGANKQIWESLGFTVHQLPDFHPFAEHLGAVHCIKKYLARG
jgi:hypothetical protein